ncbi:MAG: alpha/beta hydrolase [Clostridiales bacterium]|nr:alpha/beta hydrolase [Clostridiales bacterium]
MKRLRKVLMIFTAVIALSAIAFGAFWYHNIHWFDTYENGIKKSGAIEKQVTLPNGHLINYGEVDNDKPALLLIHGQMSNWENYGKILPELSENWHVYAIDVYGHGGSSHDESLYYLDTNGDDLIWFVDNVIGESTVVAGHSNGAITAAYIAAYGGDNIRGLVMEDPPIFSTEGDNWENAFSYRDSFLNIHEYLQSDKSECWEAYYLRHCYWGELYMPGPMPKIADYAQSYRENHPGEPVRIGFLPASMWGFLTSAVDYDLEYGENFYDLSWNHGLRQEDILADIEVPCVYIHAKEGMEGDVYLCAATREQADRAVSLIGDNCRFIETEDSTHDIHNAHTDVYLEAINSFL